MKTFVFSISTELLVLRAIVPVLLLIIAWFVGRAWFKRQVISSEECPKCGKMDFHRMHRTLIDRILGVRLPARRYYCENPLCGWSGLHIPTHSSHHSHA